MHGRIVAILSTAMYTLICVALVALAALLLGYGLWSVVRAAMGDGDVVLAVLEALGLVIVALAVFDVGKYIYEEEIERERELRSAVEARQSLTKFMVIIAIAASLEGLVQVVHAAKADRAALVDATLLLLAAVAVVVGLGVYQRLTVPTEAKEERIGGPHGELDRVQASGFVPDKGSAPAAS
jgi:putative Mn2+ efflux pump MntP